MIPVLICYPIRSNYVLLAEIKTGFTAGTINGSGGHIEPGESPEEACRRELKEELGIIAGKVKPRGIVLFTYEKKPPEASHLCYMFVTKDWEGAPRETKEAIPRWFHKRRVPYERMFWDSRLYFPNILLGKSVDLWIHWVNGPRVDYGEEHIVVRPLKAHPEAWEEFHKTQNKA